MEEDSSFQEDDYFYPSDFEEELQYVARVEEILGGTHGSNSDFDFTTTFGETYFNILDFESEDDGDDEAHEEM